MRPGGSNPRTLGRIEDAELYTGAVRSDAHESVQRVHLAHQRPLGQPADGWVARHFTLRVRACRVGGSEPAAACAVWRMLLYCDDLLMQAPGAPGHMKDLT